MTDGSDVRSEAVCPNGHPFPRMTPVACGDCGASVVCEPTCYGMELHRTLEATEAALGDARLYGEKMLRDRDPQIQRCGADLLQIIVASDIAAREDRP